MVHRLLYSERRKQTISIVAVPMAFFLLYVLAVVLMPHLSGLALWAAMLLFAGSSLGVWIYLYRHHLTVACRVTVREEGLYIRRERRTLAYLQQETYIPWPKLQQVQNRLADEEPALVLVVARPPRHIRLEAAGGRTGELFHILHAIRLQRQHQDMAPGLTPPPADAACPVQVGAGSYSC